MAEVKKFELTYAFTIIEWRTYEVEAETEEGAEALIDESLFADPDRFQVDARPMDCTAWDHMDTKEMTA